MIDEETRRLRACQIWENGGRPEGRDLAHWYKAGEPDLSAASGRSYIRYSAGTALTGSLVIKFYHSSDQIRGYVRKIAEVGEDDTIFPGEEMEPGTAFKLADFHNGDTGRRVFIELVEGVQWNPSLGELETERLEAIPPEKDDARAADNLAADRRRRKLASQVDTGLRRAIAEASQHQIRGSTVAKNEKPSKTRIEQDARGQSESNHAGGSNNGPSRTKPRVITHSDGAQPSTRKWPARAKTPLTTTSATRMRASFGIEAPDQDKRPAHTKSGISARAGTRHGIGSSRSRGTYQLEWFCSSHRVRHI